MQYPVYSGNIQTSEMHCTRVTDRETVGEHTHMEENRFPIVAYNAQRAKESHPRKGGRALLFE